MHIHGLVTFGIFACIAGTWDVVDSAVWYETFIPSLDLVSTSTTYSQYKRTLPEGASVWPRSVTLLEIAFIHSALELLRFSDDREIVNLDEILAQLADYLKVIATGVLQGPKGVAPFANFWKKTRKGIKEKEAQLARDEEDDENVSLDDEAPEDNVASKCRPSPPPGGPSPNQPAHRKP